MRPPASAFENRTDGAEKIGPSRYSDFFNRIGPNRSRRLFAFVSAVGSVPAALAVDGRGS